MIHGVQIKSLKVHQDIPDRKEDSDKPGFLMEVIRNDEDLLKKFGQTTFTVAYQGTIKAFHYHERQEDLWFVATGKAMIVLYDLREDSATKGETQVVFAGQDDYKVVRIPIGVAHGYKVLSEEPVLLFYHTTEPYDIKNPDEKRLAPDDQTIGFDWKKNNL
ncbi:MAG: dTDP-4-dehydrorhamnose 3,5-epimerase family protein [Patescibacteria group bacterium]|nr:dTDP-4-dehydrorhamnose 3,5-epimerase family protein [Patescibacteria group bacterium]